MIVEKHSFRKADLIAGEIALDFVNTVTGRDVAARDWLADYQCLLDWAGFCVEFDVRDLETLHEIATCDPGDANAALVRAGHFREALCRALYAIVKTKPPQHKDQVEIEGVYQNAMNAAQIQWGSAGCRVVWTPRRSGLDLIVHVVAVHAIGLLADLDSGRMRICDGRNCGWMFLDTSRNGLRRWCDMRTCGNVAKAHRHYRRTHAS